MTNLMEYLPDIWQEIAEMKALQSAVGSELSTQKTAIQDLLNQCFIRTATWGLALWEKEFGIAANAALPHEERRAALVGKLMGTATTTVWAVKNLAETVTGGTVNVIEKNGEYRFEVSFLKPLGTPPNMQSLAAALEQCKPAHLGFSFIYSYALWGRFLPKTWGHMKKYSWGKIKVLEEENM